MYWHIETDIFCLLFAAVFFFDYMWSTKDLSNRDKRFRDCTVALMASLVLDIAGSIVIDFKAGETLFHIVETSFFVVCPLSIVLWLFYVIAIVFEGQMKAVTRWKWVSAAPYLAYALIAAINPWTAWIYGLDENNQYFRGDLFILPYVLYGLYTLIMLVFVIRFWVRIPTRRMRFLLLLLPCIICTGIAVQSLIPGWLMIYPACTLATFLAYTFIQSSRNANIVNSLSQAASIDAMTGLYNRAAAEQLINERLARDSRCTLLIADLDDLKGINDNCGHIYGDQALRIFANMIKEHFRSSDIVARVGGDEFIVFLPETTDQSHLRVQLSSLILKLSTVYVGDRADSVVHGSIGVAIGGDGLGYDTLYKRADTALYHVKRNGKNDYAIYSPDMERSDYQYFGNADASLRLTEWFDTDGLKRLLAAISDFFPLIISINLNKDTYYIMENNAQVYLQSPAYGRYTEFLEQAQSHVQPSDRADFVGAFALENLSHAQKAGEKMVSLASRTMDNSGKYRWSRTDMIFVQDDSGDAYAISLSHVIENERTAELERLRLQKILEIAISSSFEYICILDITTGGYETYSNDGGNTHSVARTGVFAAAVDSICKHHIVNGQQERFRSNAGVEMIAQRMEETHGQYSYRYELDDGMREARFYYYEPTRKELLMTVRRL